MVDAFAERAASMLDELGAHTTRDLDLYKCAGDLAPLGILLDLMTKVEPNRLTCWEDAFEQARRNHSRARLLGQLRRPSAQSLCSLASALGGSSYPLATFLAPVHVRVLA